MWRLLAIVASLVLLACAPASATTGANTQEKPVVPLETCGDKADDGILLYRVYDESGRPADIPLALADPTNTHRIAVDAPDPKSITPVPFKCRAYVESHDGSFSLIDGVTGDVLDLAIGPPVDEFSPWQYLQYAGGQQWGIFAPAGSYTFEEAVIVDFASGQVLDLPALVPDVIEPSYGGFSPRGGYLVVSGRAVDDYRQWLIPMDEPGQARTVGGDFSAVIGFDDTDSRMLYLTNSPGEQTIVIESLDEGTTQTVAVAADSPNDDSVPGLRGYFLPGRDDLVVTYPDRTVLLDVDGETPVERFSVEGAFDSFFPAPDGAAGILYEHQPRNSTAAPEMLYVDFEDESVKPIVADTGEELRMVGPAWLGTDHPRWIYLAQGDSRDRPTGLAVFDFETGELSSILTAENEFLGADLIQSTGDGRVALVPATVVDGGERIWMLDAEKGTAGILAEAESIGVGLSPNGRWAAFSTLERSGDQAVQSLTVVDTRRDRRTDFGAGLEPIWLAP